MICIGEKNIMMDYKYTSIKDETALINKYRNQLKAYKFAIEKCLAIKIDEVYIIDLMGERALLLKIKNNKK